MEEILKNNEKVKILKEIFSSVYSVKLVGGAVIDILEGREPKDYDLIYFIPSLHNKHLLNAGFEFQYETKTARTWTKDDITIQTLKTDKDDFDFTISQAIWDLKSEKIEIDNISFKSKKLIPTPNAFLDKSKARNSLKRIRHWERKGYKIPKQTLDSLKRVAKIRLIDRIMGVFYSSDKES